MLSFANILEAVDAHTNVLQSLTLNTKPNPKLNTVTLESTICPATTAYLYRPKEQQKECGMSLCGRYYRLGSQTSGQTLKDVQLFISRLHLLPNNRGNLAGYKGFTYAANAPYKHNPSDSIALITVSIPRFEASMSSGGRVP